MLPTEPTGEGEVHRAQAGDLVCVREARWRVSHVRSAATAHGRARTRAAAQAVRVVTLRGADRENRWQECTLLEPFDRFTPWSTPAMPRLVSRRRWMRALGALAASAGVESDTALPHGMYAGAEANLALLAHQMAPLLAILRGLASRVLIADGVGLGKTIQAALVLRALMTRGRAARVLIAVPAGLRDQWRQELRERVGLDAVVIDAAALAARVRQLPSDVNPWTQPGIVIASLDFIKQDLVCRGLSAIAWDALVVDEAHALTTGTDRAVAAHLLAQHSRLVLLLTATPHAGSDAAFDALCRIGQLVDLDPIAIFRRTRRSLGLPTARRVHVLRIQPTPTERHLHDLLAKYVTRVEREHRSDEPATLAMSVLQKRASSSAWSLLRSLERRLALLSCEPVSEGQSAPHEQRPLPFDAHAAKEAASSAEAGSADEADAAGEADAADEEPLALLSAPGLSNVHVERAWLSLLIQIARRAAHHESKLRALRRLLRRVREPAIIYTEYRDTLAHVTEALPREHALSAATLHGGLTRDARTDALRGFSSGDAALLLATDAAGEGLNLHQRCRLVINVELPWNPNRLEQRIGRVDRLGQSKTVHAVHFVLAGTSEETLLEALNARLNNIATALGEGPTPATVPAAPISPTRVWPDLSVEADEAVRALEYLRALRASARCGGDPSGGRDGSLDFDPELDACAPWIATVRRQRRGPLADLAPGLLCIWRTRIRFVDAASDTARELITPLRVPQSHVHGLSTRRRELQRWLIESDVHNLMQRKLDALARSTIDSWNEREGAFRERAAARDAAISRALRAMRASLDEQAQPLLFGDIAADREARQLSPWRALPAGSDASLNPASAALSADVDHALVLVLVLR